MKAACVEHFHKVDQDSDQRLSPLRQQVDVSNDMGDFPCYMSAMGLRLAEFQGLLRLMGRAHGF